MCHKSNFVHDAQKGSALLLSLLPVTTLTTMEPAMDVIIVLLVCEPR